MGKATKAAGRLKVTTPLAVGRQPTRLTGEPHSIADISLAESKRGLAPRGAAFSSGKSLVSRCLSPYRRAGAIRRA